MAEHLETPLHTIADTLRELAASIPHPDHEAMERAVSTLEDVRDILAAGVLADSSARVRYRNIKTGRYQADTSDKRRLRVRSKRHIPSMIEECIVTLQAGQHAQVFDLEAYLDQLHEVYPRHVAVAQTIFEKHGDDTDAAIREELGHLDTMSYLMEYPMGQDSAFAMPRPKRSKEKE